MTSERSRVLRSRQLRAALWYRADGKCQQCGAPLGPGWHADHIVPWSIRPVTNIDGMQALCVRCNLRKGSTMLRQHQREFQNEMVQVAAGQRDGRVILMHVTPGGGKSLIPVIAAVSSVPEIADAVCVVTPRDTLQEQMEDAFLDVGFRGLLDHQHRIRRSTNQEDPSRGLSGYVTTYQALAADRAQVNESEFKRRRYILILDEAHHLSVDGEYTRAVEPLADLAAVVVLMTGTLERADGKRIFGVPYDRSIDGSRWVVRDPPGMPFIKYTRKQALEEHAVVPLVFQHLDGDASWIDRAGQMVAPLPISLAGKFAPDALFTALRTEYARDLLDRCVREWQGHRQAKPQSRLLVVAPNIALAKKYLAWMRQMSVARTDIATSEDSPAAKSVIDRLKGGDLDAIVTVAMAYEGLDCKQITHVACLTHIRSRAWIEQLISRANRFDPKAGPWESQRGFIYGPDDHLLAETFDKIRVEQEPFIAEEGEERVPGGPSPGDDPVSVVPITGHGTRVRVGNLDGGCMDYADTEAVLDVLKKYGLEGVVPPVDMLAMHLDLKAVAGAGPPATSVEPAPQARASQEESSLREAIERHCRGWDWDHEAERGTLNKAVFQRFGKSRKNMTIDELREVWAWLNRECPRTRSA